MNLTEPDTLAKLAKIILTDLVLAGDNAVVIALVTRALPARRRLWGRIFGAGGAVGLRVIFVFLVAWLTNAPLLQFAAGLLLLWIAWKLVRPQAKAPEGAVNPGHAKRHAARSLWHAVRVILVADVIMSLDNVIAIAGIAREGSASPHGQMGLVIFGLLLSIPLVVFGSAVISQTMIRFRWVIWLGGGVLGHVAGKIIFQDPRVLGWLGVPAAAGMPEPELHALLGAADAWVRAAVHGLPWFFAALLFALGAWWSRSAPGAAAGVREQP
jgi:YjbE family integral membrane protein